MIHTHVSENFPLQLLADAGAGFTIDIAATAATKVVATRMRLVLTSSPFILGSTARETAGSF